MVYIINAFAEIQSLISNDSQTVTPAGELSPRAKAYTRDLRTYSDPGLYPGTTVHVFNCKQNGINIAVPVSGVNRALDIAHQISENYTGSSTGRTFLENTFPDMTGISVESDVPVSGKTLIEKIECNFEIGGVTFLLKLYMSSPYFEENYDEYEIRVVPPIIPVSSLRDSYNNVLSLLNTVSSADKASMEEDALDGVPASHRRIYTLRWQDTDNNTILTDWVILGWGVESMRTDVILEAIRQYLTLNSGSSIESWKDYLPDIQVEDNFTFIPLWDQEARVAGNGIDAHYRPVINIGNIGAIGNENYATRSQTEWSEQGELMVLLRKSIPMLVIAGLGNSNQERQFGTMYSDYTLFNINDPVAGYISPSTISVIQSLEILTALAENFTGATVLPGNVTKNIINNKTFLETAVDGMLLKVLVRSDFVRP